MRTIILFTLSIALLLHTGCGDGLCRVSGTVTLDGEPLVGAFVLFTPTADEGDNATSQTDEDGRYTLQTLTGRVDGGTTPGTYVVTFSQLESVWDGRSYFVNSQNERVPDTRAVESLPSLYTSSQTSPFTVEVRNRVETFNFDLTSGP